MADDRLPARALAWRDRLLQVDLGCDRLSEFVRWRAADCDWSRLGDDLVVRAARTGSAHLLEGDPAVLFEVLAERPDGLSVDDLLAILGDASDNTSLRGAIETALLEFERCGLVVGLP